MTKFFSLQVSPHQGLCEKVARTWLLIYRSLATSPFVLKKKSKYRKKSMYFHWKFRGDKAFLLRYSIAWKFRGDRACILRYLDSSLDKNSILPEARQTPKILGAAINGHLISFWFLPISGHFRTFQKIFFRWIGSRNNSCNVRKTFVAIISRENVL